MSTSKPPDPMTNYNDYSISNYGTMIEDKRRTSPFVEALRDAIKPGSAVLDIGTGTGIFSFLACQFGAARVYAVEPDAKALEVAKRCAAGIPGSDRITWVQDLSTKIDLPERVDLVVGDLHGILPFFKGNIESMADAHTRHLKPGGRLIPVRDLLYAVPAHAPEEYRQVESPWRENDYGLDFGAATPYVINRWWRARPEPVNPEQMLATAKPWGIVDYSRIESAALDNTLEWTAERDGVMHGFYVWFDGDLGNGFGYSNAPTLPALVYGRAFFPLEQSVAVRVGDNIRVRLTARQIKAEYVFRWDTTIKATDASPKADFRQSTFKASPPPIGTLQKAHPDYVPGLNEDGTVMRTALEAMATGHPLRAVAEALGEQFPHRFRTFQAALDEATRLAQRYA